MTPPSGPDGDLFSRLGLSPSLRTIVERSAAQFEATGDWVDFDTLADEAAERDDASFDLNDAFKLPSVLGGAWTQEKISLTGLGLLVAGSAPKCAALMTRLALICAARRRLLKSEAQVSGRILISDYGFTPNDAKLAETLITMIPGLTAGGGSNNDDWWKIVFRGALNYRKVQSSEDLRAILEEDAERRLEAYRQSAARGPSLFSPFEHIGSTASPPPILFLSWGGDVSGRVAAVLQAVLRPRLPSAEVFLSTTSIDPGDDPLRRMLEDGLLKAQVLVAVLTRESSGRPWVIWETASAWARDQLVIPVFVGIKPGEVPGPLTTKVQGVHLHSREDLDRALTVIARRMGVDPSPISDDEYQQLTEAGTLADDERVGEPRSAPSSEDIMMEANPIDRSRAERTVALELAAGMLASNGVTVMPLQGWPSVLQHNPGMPGERVITATVRNSGSLPVSVESFAILCSVAGALEGAEMTLLGRNDFPSQNPDLPIRLDSGQSTRWFTSLATLRLIQSMTKERGHALKDFYVEIALGSGEAISSERYRFDALPFDPD